VSFSGAEAPLNASNGVTLNYVNEVPTTAGSSAFANLVTFQLTQAVDAGVLSSEVRGGSLYAAFSPAAAVPLQGFVLLWVSSYSVFDSVTYNGS
jgi:hypothetical protein